MFPFGSLFIENVFLFFLFFSLGVLLKFALDFFLESLVQNIVVQLQLPLRNHLPLEIMLAANIQVQTPLNDVKVPQRSKYHFTEELPIVFNEFLVVLEALVEESLVVFVDFPLAE